MAYPFIIDVEGYPQQIINLFIVVVSYVPFSLHIYALAVVTGSFLAEMENA